MALGVLDNGVGVIQAKEIGVGYQSLALQPVTGNVGIGTTSPATKLHLYGSNDVGATLTLENSAGPNVWNIKPANPGIANTGLSINDRTSGSDVTRMFFGTTGNVGIGTANPGQKLELSAGTTGFNQNVPATSGTTQNGSLRLRPGYGGEVMDFGMNALPSYAWIQPTNDSNLAINYNLSLNPNGGNVGIGMRWSGESRPVLGSS